MKIMVASDLHLEHNVGGVCQVIPENAFYQRPDVIVLAGDIDTSSNLEESLHDICDTFIDIPVIFVPGNHEYYSRLYDFEYIQNRLRNIIDRLKQKFDIRYLDNSSTTIDDINFYGGCMWSDVKHGDQYSVTCGDEDMIGMTIEQSRKLHAQFKAGLDDHIAVHGLETSVVVSHFSPSMRYSHPGFSKDGHAHYFSANMDQYIDSKLKAWIFGHTHASVYDVAKNGTQVISCQQGYGFEKGSIYLDDPKPFSMFDI